MANSPASRQSRVRSAPPKPRTGSQEPRVWTPPLRRLTKKTSLGFDVIAFAEDVCEMTLLPWQKWLLIHALELLPDNSFRFRTIVVLVARQNGKSTLSQILALWAMYRLNVRLVLGTAQDLSTAEDVWAGAVEIAQDIPELAEQIAHHGVVLNNGRKSLKLKTGEKYRVKAANRRAGRGMSGDLVFLDELREHQSWDSWGAVTKTTMARPDAQVWAFSNAGDASSIVLRYLRKMAHATLGDPDGINADDDPSAALLPAEGDLGEDVDETDEDSLAIFEWSAAPGCDVADRDGWAQANPAMSHLISEKTIASACKTDPEWVFRTEVLCQWSDGSLEGPFPAGAWDDCLDVSSTIREGSKIFACVDVSWDRARSHIAFAGLTDSDIPHVEVVASRAGTEWVVPWLTERVGSLGIPGIVVQAKGSPATSLLDEMKAANLPVIEWGGSDLGGATGAFYDLVRSKALRHLQQPLLDIAAATAVTRPMGDSWVWDRKHSPTDIAPLVAVTGAVWALRDQTNAPFVSKYESADLLVVS